MACVAYRLQAAVVSCAHRVSEYATVTPCDDATPQSGGGGEELAALLMRLRQRQGLALQSPTSEAEDGEQSYNRYPEGVPYDESGARST